MALVPAMTYEIALATRLGTKLANRVNLNPLTVGQIRELDQLGTKYPHATPRPTDHCYAYNCHGLTFASRRTWIGPVEVETILNDDGYVKVDKRQFAAGDVVLYRATETSEIEHSGVVLTNPQPGELLPNPLILSKWGTAREFVHPALHCDYLPADLEYYRLRK